MNQHDKILPIVQPVAGPIASETLQRVLVIYTGGTIGMVESHKDGALMPFDFSHILNKMPEIAGIACKVDVLTWESPIDSSNITPEHWSKLADTVGRHYHDYDGFVILHGTDTMAYTASALSFMFENLAKPVVLTGSQLPVGSMRTDARANFVSALEIASHRTNGIPTVPEVCILFDAVLIRGNRGKKIANEQFAAFISENSPALAQIGVSIRFNHKEIGLMPHGIFRVSSQVDDRVAIFKIYPGISAELIHLLMDSGKVKAVILETFGMGNIPNDPNLLKVLELATANGIIIVNVSQCMGGEVVQGKYEAGTFLDKIGVVSGKDITTEAALAKLICLLGRGMDHQMLKYYMGRPIALEMSA